MEQDLTKFTAGSDESERLRFRIDQRQRQLQNIKLIARGMVGMHQLPTLHRIIPTSPRLPHVSPLLHCSRFPPRSFIYVSLAHSYSPLLTHYTASRWLWQFRKAGRRVGIAARKTEAQGTWWSRLNSRHGLQAHDWVKRAAWHRT